MSKERGDVGQEFYEDKEWSESQLRKVVREEAKIYMRQKRRTLLEDVGTFILEGRVGIRSNGEKGAEFLIDHTEVSSFLNAHFRDGDTVKLVVMQEEGDDAR